MAKLTAKNNVSKKSKVSEKTRSFEHFKFENLLDARKLTFLAIFSILAIFAMNINFSKLIGAENQFFTLFQFFGPVVGAFLGPFIGIISVLLAEVGNMLIFHKAFTLLNVLRLLPMLFATYYFATRKDKLNFSNWATMIIPLIAIAIFIAHPVGRTVWFFSLFWTIPIIITVLPKAYSNNPWLKGLGATFTAHAIGGAIWVWTVPMTKEMWITLIPIVAYERLLFALGIGCSYYLFNTLLDKIDEKTRADAVHVDDYYVIGKKKMRI